MVGAYAVPAAAAWMLAGLILGALPLRTAALLLMAGYGACYGLAEAAGKLGRPGTPGRRGRPAWSPPGSRWQVPQSLVADISIRRRVLVWGSVLGPGFATRNPYAGFAVLPLAVAAAGSIPAAVALAAAVGVVHGTGRALALLRDARDLRGGAPADHLALVLKSMHWRTLDGFALLLVAGAAAAACLQRF